MVIFFVRIYGGGGVFQDPESSRTGRTPTRKDKMTKLTECQSLLEEFFPSILRVKGCFEG